MYDPLYKEISKKYDGFGREEFLKTVNNADQTYLEGSLELYILLLKQNYYC